MNPFNTGKGIYYLMFFFILLGVCCNYTMEELTKKEKQQIKKEVTQLLYGNFERIKAEGYTAELKSLDNSPDFYWIPPRQSMPISYDAVAAIIEKFVQGNRSVVSTWDTLHVQPLSKQIATYTGKYHSVYTDTAGKVLEFDMQEIGTVVKRKEGWKLMSGKTSVLQ